MPLPTSPGSNWLYQKGNDIRAKTFNGNTASMSGASFTYDGYNRLATSTTPSQTTTYTYNALGERIKKINQNGLATSFHYGNNGELLYERDQAGNTKAYVWLDGRPLARIDNDATIYYYHVDHLGTPQAMTNAAGAVVWKADYEPFGKVTVKVNTIENNLRFPGQYADRETGLYYNYFRDYDSGSGRYIEADPIGLDGGMNVYSYANQNPLSFTDLLGLNPFGGGDTRSPGIPGPPTDVFFPGTPANNALGQSIYRTINAVKEMCETKDCPPCKTVSGKIVQVGTLAYRPLDVIPDDVMQHGVYGSHHNIFVAIQAPRNAPKPCQCRWVKRNYVLKPYQLTLDMIPIEPFAN